MGVKGKGEEQMEEHIHLTLLDQIKDHIFCHAESRCLWKEAKSMDFISPYTFFAYSPLKDDEKREKTSTLKSGSSPGVGAKPGLRSV